MEAILNNFFNIPIYIQVAPFLLQGLLNTLLLSALVIPFGLAAGLLVGVLSITLKNRWARGALAIYIDVFRALPPLVLLIFVYYGTPFLGLELPKLLAIVIGFIEADDDSQELG